MRLILIFILFIPQLSFSQEIKKHFLTYNPSYQVTWDDFKAPPVKHSRNAANSYTGIDLSTKMINDSLTITVYSFFNQNESCVKKESLKDALLLHEQFHFHITELFARKLRKELIEFHFTQKNIKTKLQPIFDDALNALWKEQKKYDKETNHHINTKEQKKWERKIKAELKTYDAYTNTKVVILLD